MRRFWPGRRRPGTGARRPRRADGPVYGSRLTVTFREEPGGGTLLTLVHERLGELAAAMPGVAENVGPGWESAPGQLAAVFAPPAWLPRFAADSGGS